MIKLFRDKKNIAAALFILTAVLLLTQIIVNKIYPDTPPPKETPELSASEVSSMFRRAVLNYGFEDGWIVEKQVPDQEDEQFRYLIKVPKDVPIALLIKEITDLFQNTGTDILVEEKKINGNNYLRILSNDHLKLSADFVYTPDIYRKSGAAGTLIFYPENISGEDFQKVISSPQLMGIVLVPSKANVNLSRNILAQRKEFVILLNDNIKELEYKLGGNFSENRIKDVIRTIIGAYPRASFYLFDVNSSLYNSGVRDLIMNEFTRRNIKIIPTDNLLFYEAEDGRNFSQLISKIDEDRKLIAIPADLYFTIYQEFDNFRKIGFKFVNPSVIIN